MAAGAFDVAAYCLRGNLALLNFLDSLPVIENHATLGLDQIKEAAVQHDWTLPAPPPPPAVPAPDTDDWSFLDQFKNFIGDEDT